jgi:hypothetical protein
MSGFAELAGPEVLCECVPLGNAGKRAGREIDQVGGTKELEILRTVEREITEQFVAPGTRTAVIDLKERFDGAIKIDILYRLHHGILPRRDFRIFA